ncbi:Peptidoglycan O-acetyltransferase [Defluviimonas aquaemixtae]|uniref:Probable alginate O-acetylase AlgI n=1 Tax=Albidovulum aquaemixtae TaxID=1542388 RepID=A0A2R8B872_9RHOB|nr:MBOAT family O-acyltransferase [Defluviimonas aquaemixtae]SPH18801.1 Peptidoglycan O-acetyltransferase [Defluviimonas aquaemixtae]
MLFTTLDFLLFLPVAVLVFWLLPVRLRLPWLVLASVIFYGSFGLQNLIYLAIVIVIVLIAGRMLRTDALGTRRVALWGGTFVILALMGLLKYYDPIAAEINGLPTLGLSSPAGFSFYAFTAIALIVDRYRDPAAARASDAQEVLYLAWFPKILAGPIERIGPFIAELTEKSPLTWPQFALGCQLILWGIVKKVVVADNLAPFVDRTYAIPAYAVPVELIIASYFFAFQIYCDFSGYTDIARGTSQLFGIRLSENFRRSYFAHSIGEFWSRRWHISLADWFRDYVYFPLVGSERKAWRMYAGLMVVFILSGIWHAGLGYGIGWGFVAWGILNGAYLWGERALNPLRRRLRKRLGASWLGSLHTFAAILVVFHLILVSWVFFRAGDLGDAALILGRIWDDLPALPALLPNYPFTAEHGFLAALIAALLVIETLMERPRIAEQFAAAARPLRWLVWLACLFALIVLGRWDSEVFVYMQF